MCKTGNRQMRAFIARLVVVRTKVSVRQVHRAVILSALAVSVWSGEAMARNEAIATVQSGFQSENLDATGTLRLFTFTQQFAFRDPVSGNLLFMPFGPNATPGISAVRGGVAGLTSPLGMLTTTEGDPINITTPTVGANPVGILYGQPGKVGPRVGVESDAPPRSGSE